VSYYAKMLPVLGISFFVDGLHASLSGKIWCWMTMGNFQE
jgi:hypothetical protein